MPGPNISKLMLLTLTCRFEPKHFADDARDADLLIEKPMQLAADAGDAHLWTVAPKQFAADARDAGGSCVPDPMISKLMLVMLILQQFAANAHDADLSIGAKAIRS